LKLCSLGGTPKAGLLSKKFKGFMWISKISHGMTGKSSTLGEDKGRPAGEEKSRGREEQGKRRAGEEKSRGREEQGKRRAGEEKSRGREEQGKSMVYGL
jgi:hypothetical protein